MPADTGAASAPAIVLAQPLGIGSYADREGYTVGEEIALTDAKVRRTVSYVIVGAFVFANLVTLAGVAIIVREDNANIVAHAMAAQDRVITPGVVMALVGATTIQLGALAVTMGRYLYPAAYRPGPS